MSNIAKKFAEEKNEKKGGNELAEMFKKMELKRSETSEQYEEKIEALQKKATEEFHKEMDSDAMLLRQCSSPRHAKNINHP